MAPLPFHLPGGADDLGLRRAVSGRLLPLLVAAMAFLAALACAGADVASGLAAHWRMAAAGLVTVQVPQPDRPAAADAGAMPSGVPAVDRAGAVAAVLATLPGAQNRRLGADELADIMRPWLGEDAARLSLLLPATFEVRAASGLDGLQTRLDQVAPGTLVERNAVWSARLSNLSGTLRDCAWLVLLLVAFVSASVIALAARAALAARRDAIEIVHGLGATDRMIASRFAGRVTLLAFVGAALGVALTVPVLLALARLTAGFQPQPPASAFQASVPAGVWATLPALPVLAALIGWLTTQLTVRRWLWRLP